MDQVLEALRRATEDTPYEGRLYLVGGIVRDRLLSGALDEDIDIVLEGDAGELASFLFETGVAAHKPVTYPRFGTAMVVVQGRQVELVGARKESYDRESRKPNTEPGSLLDDDNLAILAQMAAERDYQIWIERVDKTGKIGIVMEEGEVVADNQEAPAEVTA